MIPTLFVGESRPAPAGGDPEDLFKVTPLVKGDEAALPVDQTGCKMSGRPDSMKWRDAADRGVWSTGRRKGFTLTHGAVTAVAPANSRR